LYSSLILAADLVEWLDFESLYFPGSKYWLWRSPTNTAYSTTNCKFSTIHAVTENPFMTHILYQLYRIQISYQSFGSWLFTYWLKLVIRILSWNWVHSDLFLAMMSVI